MVDVPLYVMTPEFGAASQLEKIDMLDFAEFVAINKFDRKGAQRRAARCGQAGAAQPRGLDHSPERHAGVRHHGRALQRRWRDRAVPGPAAAPAGAGPAGAGDGALPHVSVRHSTNQTPVVPAARARYLAEISRHRARLQAARRAQARLAREIQQLRAAHDMLRGRRTRQRDRAAESRRRPGQPARRDHAGRLQRASCSAQWPDMQKAYAGDEYVVKIRDKEIRTALTTKSLSAAPPSARWPCRSYEDHGEILKWLMLDNVPGSFPYTAGTFAFKREGEDPTRMFAGEGDAFRTNTPLQAAQRRHAGQAPVHRVRLGHAVRQRPRPAPRHLRQGGQLGVSHRHAGRHEGAVRRLRPVQPRHHRVA